MGVRQLRPRSHQIFVDHLERFGDDAEVTAERIVHGCEQIGHHPQQNRKQNRQPGMHLETPNIEEPGTGQRGNRAKDDKSHIVRGSPTVTF